MAELKVLRGFYADLSQRPQGRADGFSVAHSSISEMGRVKVQRPPPRGVVKVNGELTEGGHGECWGP